EGEAQKRDLNDVVARRQRLDHRVHEREQPLGDNGEADDEGGIARDVGWHGRRTLRASAGTTNAQSRRGERLVRKWASVGRDGCAVAMTQRGQTGSAEGLSCAGLWWSCLMVCGGTRSAPAPRRGWRALPSVRRLLANIVRGSLRQRPWDRPPSLPAVTRRVTSSGAIRWP